MRKEINLQTGEILELEDAPIVDWRTPEEIGQEAQAQFRTERDRLLVETDIEINKLVDLELDSTEWRKYRQGLRDSTSTWVLPSKPEGAK